MTETPTAHVRARRDGRVGHLTLTRPRAINALDGDMIRALTVAFDEWESHADVDLVLLDGEGERGFCAGGDVRGLYTQIRSGDVEAAGEFFRTEYALNARIAEFPKPVVAIADGVTMGGGIGLAGHAAVRIVTERSQLAMPETRIGFSPDVGGSWLLSRAPGRIGEYLALTGGTMDAADAIFAGFADHLVPSDRLDDLRDALVTRADPQTPAEIVLLFDETPEPSRLAADRSWIDEVFAAATVEEILAGLSARSEPRAQETRELLSTLPPTALTVTLAAVRSARALPNLRAALTQEYGLMMWFARTQPDLIEGIRARLVDKDQSPRWQPSSFADLPAHLAAQALVAVPTVPLWG